MMPTNRRTEHKRVPRKFKKKYKHILCGTRYDFLTLSQQIWYILYLTNNDYARFIIKKTITEEKNI